jgi:phage shock protein PspC (stress-responsive transcriptional regulator)
VCAGLPDTLALGTNGLRLLFVLASFLGGIGVVAYLTCWLVIPSQDQDPEKDPVRSVVLLAWATGGLVVLVLIGSLAAIATVFGFGWVVFAVAAVITGLTFSPLRKRIPTLVTLLAIAALTLPAMAVALSPVRLTFQSGETVARPASYTALRQAVYRSGFGTLLIDLRRTPGYLTRNTTLRIDAGLRRTIVALPTDRCTRVRINYDIHLFPAHLAALFTGHYETPFHDVVLFGKPYGYGALLGGHASAKNLAIGSADAPVLTIDFTSQGGGLYVRDYPDSIDPSVTPQWPGYPVTLEPRPYLKNEPRRLRKSILRAWHRRLAAERASQQYVDRHMAGPCAGPINPPTGSATTDGAGTALLPTHAAG